MTGFRVSEAIRQTKKNVKLDSNIHIAIGAKGGLNNIVHTDHHDEFQRDYIKHLINNPEPGSNRIFHRQKDAKGNYKSDEQIRKAVTDLANKCARKLGVSGNKGKTFSSHCFREAFAHERMLHYVRNYQSLEGIIRKKIYEQPSLAKKYANFENELRKNAKIQHHEKFKLTKEFNG